MELLDTGMSVGNHLDGWTLNSGEVCILYPLINIMTKEFISELYTKLFSNRNSLAPLGC